MATKRKTYLPINGLPIHVWKKANDANRALEAENAENPELEKDRQLLICRWLDGMGYTYWVTSRIRTPITD